MAIDYSSRYGSANDVQGFGIGFKGGNAGVMPSGNQIPAYEKAMADRYANTVVSPGIFGTTIGQQKGYTGQGAAGGRSPSLASSNNSGGGGGGLSFSTGRGGQYSSVPSNVLNTRQFAPYESTYTPPTPATPDPYNYATRDPYTYGEGLSNAGAAYDIWGSKPGTNPYRLTTPDSYTPGILGLDPVTLPGNMTNKGADISSLSNVKQRQKFTGTPEQIIRDYGYTDRTAPMQNNVPPSMRDSAPNAGVMLAAAAKNVSSGIYPNMKAAMDAQVAFSKKYPAYTPAENAAQIAASQKMLLSQDQRPRVETKTTRLSNIPAAGTGASGPPGRNYTAPTAKSTPVTYTAKKSSAKAAVKNYSTKTINNSFSARRDVRNLFA
tara:strand:- start:740 stop:1873 length:1134 start_codon:yes stop_codon:yes gene_type:complete